MCFFFLFMSVRSSGRPYVCLSACPPVSLSVCRLSVCLSLHLSICLCTVRVSAYCVCLLSECLSVSPFIHLSVCFLKRLGFCMSGKTLAILDYTVSWPSHTLLTNRDSKSSVFVAIYQPDCLAIGRSICKSFSRSVSWYFLHLSVRLCCLSDCMMASVGELT